MIVKLNKVVLVKVLKNSFTGKDGTSVDYSRARLVDEDVNVLDVSISPEYLSKCEKAIKWEGSAELSLDNTQKGYRVRLVNFIEAK